MEEDRRHTEEVRRGDRSALAECRAEQAEGDEQGTERL